MAAEQTLEVDQGAYWSQQLLWKDSGGNPVNLAGYTARMQVRRTRDDATVLVELTTSNSRITLGGSAGTILLELDATTTAALPAETARYDLELVPGNGQVRRLLEGRFVISREVTR